jgi:hypothetical protein
MPRVSLEHGAPDRIILEHGKYIVINDNGILTAKRHGEDWPAADSSLCGDSLSLAMVHRILDLQKVNASLVELVSESFKAGCHSSGDKSSWDAIEATLKSIVTEKEA